ncbi:MAG: 4Fe-4S dicluster domain-containing protein [Candidatus Omnitrophica bacterium]|nr:4Fe-4S dicluster domain-containing protein [Candidatus Omnitrophota bacterium]
MNRIKHYKTFKGGYKFVNFTGQPQDKLIELGAPKEVLIPLRQGFGNEVMPIVKVGDEVKAGQIIGRDDESISSPIHSSITGKVKEIIKKNYFRREVTFIVIEGDTSSEWLKLDISEKDWRLCTEEELEKKLYLSGVTRLGTCGIPTRYKSSIISPNEVEYLFVHGIGSEPYNILPKTLLSGKKLFHFIEGIQILKKILPKAKIYLCLSNKEKKLSEEIEKLTYDFDWFELALLEPKYPQGYDEMLVPTILGKSFPYGYSAANIGIISLNIRAILHVYEAIVENKPFIDRIIALSGPGFKENPHIKVRIGTPLQEIIKNYLVSETRVRVILNSLMTGHLLNDYSLPVDSTFSHIIAIPENTTRELFSFLRPGLHSYSYSNTFLTLKRFSKRPDTNIHGEERPCISCSWCEEVCPVGIIPHLLSKMVKKNMIDERLMKYGIFNCIGCNLCSFVCPSKIPLAKNIKDGQEKLIVHGCDRTQCILPYFDLKGLEEYRGIK